MEQIKIDGILLEGWYGINERREDFEEFLKHTNGCGSGDAWIDFVPDTMYGLSVTPICSLHDDAFVFCPATRVAFNQANKEFYENLRVWIKAKSTLLWRYPRYLRAYWYHLAVKYKGWPSFCACKEALGEEIQDG